MEQSLNKVLQKLREKERKKRVWSPSQREMNKVGEDRKDEKKRRIYEDIWERSGQRQTEREREREREREERVCVCWAEALSDVFACSRVCSSVCTCVSLLRASHATECTFLTLSILHTHTHTVTHSPSEPHSWRAVASSARLNHRRHPLLPHFHPHFSLKPLLLPHSSSLSLRFVSLSSLSLWKFHDTVDDRWVSFDSFFLSVKNCHYLPRNCSL